MFSLIALAIISSCCFLCGGGNGEGAFIDSSTRMETHIIRAVNGISGERKTYNSSGTLTNTIDINNGNALTYTSFQNHTDPTTGQNPTAALGSAVAPNDPNVNLQKPKVPEVNYAKPEVLCGQHINPPERSIYGNFLGDRENFSSSYLQNIHTAPFKFVIDGFYYLGHYLRNTLDNDYTGAIDSLVERASIPGLFINMNYAENGLAEYTKFGKKAGTHAIWGSKPDSPEFVGADGMAQCIGIVIFSPSTGLRAAFHFSQTDAAYATLGRYNWPADCKAILAGAYNGNLTTKDQFAEVLAFLQRARIKVEGFMSADNVAGIFVDRLGNWIVVPSPNYIKFFNDPAPTIYPHQN